LQRFSEVTEQRGCNLFSPLDYFFNCHFQNFKKFGKWGLNVLTIYPANQNKNQQSKYLLVDFYFLLINTFLYQKTKNVKYFTRYSKFSEEDGRLLKTKKANC